MTICQYCGKDFVRISAHKCASDPIYLIDRIKANLHEQHKLEQQLANLSVKSSIKKAPESPKDLSSAAKIHEMLNPNDDPNIDHKKKDQKTSKTSKTSRTSKKN